MEGEEKRNENSPRIPSKKIYFYSLTRSRTTYVVHAHDRERKVIFVFIHTMTSQFLPFVAFVAICPGGGGVRGVEVKEKGRGVCCLVRLISYYYF